MVSVVSISPATCSKREHKACVVRWTMLQVSNLGSFLKVAERGPWDKDKVLTSLEGKEGGASIFKKQATSSSYSVT